MQTPNVHQLEETYRQMTDEQLLKLAEDLNSLTDPAKEALKAELYRRHLEEAEAPPPPAPAESANLDTPELRQLRETYSHMTDTQILRLASEMDSLADQAADVLHAEVCRRNLEETVAGEAAQVLPPEELEEVVAGDGEEMPIWRLNPHGQPELQEVVAEDGEETSPPEETEDSVTVLTHGDSLRYARFWPRLGAFLWDIWILLPLLLLLLLIVARFLGSVK